MQLTEKETELLFEKLETQSINPQKAGHFINTETRQTFTRGAFYVPSTNTLNMLPEDIANLKKPDNFITDDGKYTEEAIAYAEAHGTLANEMTHLIQDQILRRDVDPTVKYEGKDFCAIVGGMEPLHGFGMCSAT